MGHPGLAEVEKEGTWTSIPVWGIPLVSGGFEEHSDCSRRLTLLNRRVLFFPYGNHVDYASFYLEHAWEKEPPENWYACVQFALVLWNVNDPSIYVSHGMYLVGPCALFFRPSEPECSRYAPFQCRRGRLGLYQVL
jgi:hypothetical protein